MNLPRKILIADAEPSIRLLILKVLSPWEALILEVEDGNHAMIVAVQNTPDLFLIDNDLPDTSGIELASDLREDDRFEESTIIMLSSDPEPNSKNGKVRPWDGWIIKPFNVHTLRDEVLQMMAARIR